MTKAFNTAHHQDYHRDWTYLGTRNGRDFYVRVNEEVRGCTNLSIVYGTKPNEYISPYFPKFDDTIQYQLTENDLEMHELLLKAGVVEHEDKKLIGKVSQKEFLPLFENREFEKIIDGGTEEAFEVCNRGILIAQKRSHLSSNPEQLNLIRKEWVNHCWQE